MFNTKTPGHGPFSALIFSIDSILGQALGDRSKVITIRHPSSAPRAITQAHLSILNTIFIGILHDHSHAFLVVDKTELRRFKGRRIIKSVVWDVKTAEEKTHVPTMIVQHILHRHFGLETDAMTTWWHGYDAALRISPTVSKVLVDSRVPISFKAAMTPHLMGLSG